MQNALGAALGEYAKASGELYHSAFTQSQNDYRFAKWQMAVLALALVIVLVAVWYGIRHILLNPLGASLPISVILAGAISRKR